MWLRSHFASFRTTEFNDLQTYLLLGPEKNLLIGKSVAKKEADSGLQQRQQEGYTYKVNTNILSGHPGVGGEGGRRGENVEEKNQ
jgi:hypothetical protein